MPISNEVTRLVDIDVHINEEVDIDIDVNIDMDEDVDADIDINEDIEILYMLQSKQVYISHNILYNMIITVHSKLNLL